jgi:CheY-like chemotaxis protein
MRIIRYQSERYGTQLGQLRAEGDASILIDRQEILGVDPIASTQRVLRGMHAVVADDDDAMRELVTAVLQHLGCTCTVCTDGADAMRAIGQPFDLMVTDIRMPHFDGYELFATAREHREEVPILLITGFGYDPTHSLIKCADEGHHNVLYKPFTADQLRTEVCNAVLDVAEHNGPFVQLSGQAQIAQVLPPIEPRQVVRVTLDSHTQALTIDHSLAASLYVDLLVSGGSITLPTDQPQHEMQYRVVPELAVAIGADARRIEPEDAEKHIFGLTAALRIRPESVNVTPPPTSVTSLARELVTYDECTSQDALTISVTTTTGGPDTRTVIPEWRQSLHTILCRLSHEMLLEAGTLVLVDYPAASTTIPVGIPQGAVNSVQCSISRLGTVAHTLPRSVPTAP